MRDKDEGVLSYRESVSGGEQKSLSDALTSRYHLESQAWVPDEIARTGFSATNDITELTRLYRFSILISFRYHGFDASNVPLWISN